MKTWNSITEYVTDNPSAERHYAALAHGHQLNKGHDLDVTITLNDGLVTITRDCCKQAAA